MQTPVEIAYRHFEPSERVRAEIDAQTQRLEKFGPDVVGCHVVVSGPEHGRRDGDGVAVQLRIALPNRKDVIVDRRRGPAGPEHALVAIRQAFDAARRQIEDAEQTLRGDVKVHAPARWPRGSVQT
ncbi:sigma 54 modulation/S30EA-like ribosomal protein [Roseiarcus fermentans]|uniref:Sigma 54 modulation/S30EA-like ribosomal protein n=1 Tax=Roseiarcus fermentans TaxID=1473586 RepID=A0A366FDB5_9HYPH|nr:HPF/RaiA family ribosome-associated protein [Roseiarcus fermentans]RBP11940.1 sigma 54 modulation/S30EA-like ribosomal protein [Roseiarcus fermentans]